MTTHEGEEDVLLAQLTEDEIAELNEIIDPDNVLLPASERMPVQTTKKAEEPFNRDKLLEHLKKEAKESKVGEDYVPYVPKEKPSKNEEVHQTKITFTTEFDDILQDLDEADLAELAGELGIHGVLNQAQSRGDKNAPMKARASPIAARHKINLNFEMPQESVVLEAVAAVVNNDPTLTELNLNNHPLVQPEHLHQLLEGLRTNTNVETVSLVNVKLVDKHASPLADVIRDNDVIRSLNIESNRLSVQGVKQIIKALKHNSTIREIRMSNQLAQFGHRTEDEIAKMLQYNTTILKFGYSFQSNGPRFEAQRHLMRNTEQERQKRQNLAV